MFEFLRRRLFPPDEYALMQIAPERQVIERLEEPITSLEAETKYQLGDGKYRLQEIRGGAFGAVLWAETIGDPKRAGETDELRREIEEIRRAVSSAGQPADFDDQLKRATFQSVLEGDLDVGAAKQLAQLSAAFDNGGGKGLSESVTDPTDVGEIAGRSVLNLMDDPGKLEEFSKASGSAASAFLDGALGEVDLEQNGHQDHSEDEGSTQSRFDSVESGPETIEDLDDESWKPRTREMAEELLDEAEDVDEEPDLEPADAEMPTEKEVVDAI